MAQFGPDLVAQFDRNIQSLSKCASSTTLVAPPFEYRCRRLHVKIKKQDNLHSAQSVGPANLASGAIVYPVSIDSADLASGTIIQSLPVNPAHWPAATVIQSLPIDPADLPAATIVYSLGLYPSDLPAAPIIVPVAIHPADLPAGTIIHSLGMRKVYQQQHRN